MKIKTLSIVALMAATLTFSAPSYSDTPKDMDSSAEIATQVTELKEQVYEIEEALQMFSVNLKEILQREISVEIVDYNSLKNQLKESREREARAKIEKKEKESRFVECIKQDLPMEECNELLN